jgi:ABC-type Na+ transport system ATPase subunit NatA
MLLGIMGKMGAGKTLTMSILAEYVHQKTGLPLYANYGLEGSIKITDLQALWKVESAIFCFDEMWLTMDSRLWANNVELTRWINQTRKKKLLVIYTTQHISQIEMRVRKGTDVLIYCEKRPGGHWLQFIDYQYQQLGRRYLLEHPERFYGIYDTYEVLEPLKFSKSAFKN